MVNAIGLANPGLEAFWPTCRGLAPLRAPVIVSVGGRARTTTSPSCAAWRSTSPPPPAAACRRIAGYELNVSCPNVASGCLSIGTDERETAAWWPPCGRSPAAS